MIVLLDTSESLDVCADELGCEVGQLLTPLSGFRLREPDRAWAIDSGAFAQFDAKAYLSRLRRCEEHKAKCLWVTVPDIVGSARRTLEVFDAWRPKLEGWRLALAIQDGQENLPIPWNDIDAVFIGGTTAYKISQHAVHIIKAAQALGKLVHVGRVNDPARFSYFEELGVDSVDGTGIAQYSHMRDGIARRHHQEKLFASEA